MAPFDPLRSDLFFGHALRLEALRGGRAYFQP